MKIALISVHYPPIRSSCAVQMKDLAQELLLQGYEPIVIVPNLGIEKGSIIEEIKGVQVYRLTAFKIIDIGFIRRTVNEILMPFTMLRALRKSNFPIKDLDAVIWYSPTIFFGPIIKYLKRSSNCPSYLILRDIFPEWLADLGILKKNPIYYFFKLVAKYQYSLANIIGVQSRSNLKYLEYWEKKPNRKLEILNNWLAKVPDHKTSISITNSSLKGRKIFIYLGNMGIAQGMKGIISLAESLQHRQDIGFLFVGRGTEAEYLKSYVIDKELDNVLFYDVIDPIEIPRLLAACDVGLIALDPRHKSHNIPGKFLTYMLAGLPVLAKINKGTDLASLIEKEKVGRVFVGNEINDFQNLAEKLIDNKDELKLMSKRSENLSYDMFSPNQAVSQIIKSLQINL